MTSQTWLTSNDSDRSIWWHFMAVVVPETLRFSNVGVVYVTGNSNTDPIPTSLNEDEALCISVALADQVICTVLWQIPNQPIVFNSDPTHQSRSEDAMIAFTWNHFIMVNQSEPFWLARLPMTKVCFANRFNDTCSFTRATTLRGCNSRI
jgi:PhoPQ-activated pathogenicity-related protein